MLRGRDLPAITLLLSTSVHCIRPTARLRLSISHDRKSVVYPLMLPVLINLDNPLKISGCHKYHIPKRESCRVSNSNTQSHDLLFIWKALSVAALALSNSYSPTVQTLSRSHEVHNRGKSFCGYGPGPPSRVDKVREEIANDLRMLCHSPQGGSYHALMKHHPTQEYLCDCRMTEVIPTKNVPKLQDCLAGKGTVGDGNEMI